MRRSRKRTNEAYPEFFEAVVERDGLGCWLWRPMETFGACSGLMDAMHLIAKQRIRDERSARRLGFKEGPVLPEGVEWDPRLGKIGCRHHHNLLDGWLGARIPRAAVPALVEEWAREFGMVWSLDRDFGRPDGEGL